MEGRQLGHQLVEARPDVVGELDFKDGPLSIGRHAGGHPEDGRLGQRGIEDLLRGAGGEALGEAEDAPLRILDVLPEEDHFPAFPERGLEGGVDGVDHAGLFRIEGKGEGGDFRRRPGDVLHEVLGARIQFLEGAGIVGPDLLLDGFLQLREAFLRQVAGGDHVRFQAVDRILVLGLGQFSLGAVLAVVVGAGMARDPLRAAPDKGRAVALAGRLEGGLDTFKDGVGVAAVDDGPLAGVEHIQSEWMHLVRDR